MDWTSPVMMMMICLPPKQGTRPLLVTADTAARTQLAGTDSRALSLRGRNTPTDASPTPLKRPTLAPRPQRREGLRPRIGVKGTSTLTHRLHGAFLLIGSQSF